MNIFNYFKKKGIDTVDPSFYRKIAEWISWYEGNVRNFSFYKVYSGRGTYKRCRRKSMGMAKKLSEDIADLLLNERVTITLDDDQTDEYVQQVLDDNRFLVMGNDYQERKAFTGTVAYIPYLEDVEITEDGEVLSGRICINYVDAPNIYPVTWNNGRVTECIFAFPHTISRKKYVQLQSHLLENGEYVISNTVLRCESGSQEGTELTEEEWKLLKPFKTLAKEVRTGSAEPQFVIDRLNITNNAGYYIQAVYRRCCTEYRRNYRIQPDAERYGCTSCSYAYGLGSSKSYQCTCKREDKEMPVLDSESGRVGRNNLCM